MKRRTVTRTLSHPERYSALLVPRNVREYDAAVSLLNALVDEIGDHPHDPRYRFIDTLSVLIEAYDKEHHQIPDASGVEMLKFLMEEHRLSQGELPEVGSQGVVSEVLNGKRELNTRQIQALSRRFHLSPAVFFPVEETEAATFPRLGHRRSSPAPSEPRGA
jgi:HTH-type transcriptional regulator / antitoxin HigA